MLRAVSPAPSPVEASAIGPGPAVSFPLLRPVRTEYAVTPRLFDVTMLMVTIVLGGQYFNWNAMLAAGLVPATTAFCLVGSAYIVLLFSLAELASVFPFSGGAYALARKSLGFFGGFLVGALDATEFVLYISVAVVVLADMVVANTPPFAGWEPFLWLLFYASAIFLQTQSHQLFWRVNTVLGLCSLGILLTFCIGSFSKSDLRQNSIAVLDTSTQTSTDVPKLSDMLRVVPFCAWFYAGADAIVLIADHVDEPRVTVPRAQRLGILLLVGTAVWTLFITAGLPPGITTLAATAAPLNYGFTSFTSLSLAHSTWLSVPAIYATAFGFLWAFGRLIEALGASGLAPNWLAARMQQQARQNKSLSSRIALSMGSLLSFGVCLMVHYGRSDKRRITRICIGLAFLSYIAQTLGYVFLKNSGSGSGAITTRGPSRNPLLRSKYTSPFGVYGAYFALFVWVLGLISVVGFQDDGFQELAVIAVLLIVLTVYYYSYAQYHQIISSDERGVAQALTAAAKASARALVQQQQQQRIQPQVVVIQNQNSNQHQNLNQTPTWSGSGSANSASSKSPSLIRAGSAPSRIPELERVDSKLNNLLEELHDDMDEPYIAEPSVASPRANPQQMSQPQSQSHSQPVVMLGAMRRAGSDSVLASSTISGSSLNSGGGGGSGGGGASLMSVGWGRSFLSRQSRIERIREETERDLRSAVSGIWSERSVRWSRGRGG